MRNLTTPYTQAKNTNNYHQCWYLRMASTEECLALAFAHVLNYYTTPDRNNLTASPWVPFSGTAVHSFFAFKYEACCRVLDCHKHWLCFWLRQLLRPSSLILCYAMEGFGCCMCLDPLHRSRLNSGPQLPVLQ